MNLQNVVHPSARSIPVAGGAWQVLVAPWTMAQRAAVRPKLLALFARLGLDGKKVLEINLSDLFLHVEQELVEIVQASVRLPDGLTWDQLLWEDIPVLVQAIWEVCVVRGDQGIAGKIASALGQSLRALALERLVKEMPMTLPSASSEGSPSSPAGGAPTPIDSVTL